uniref:Uncharacterized protein n=1 Tax=Arundo donax TaxID=35708 RepID=A0A0A9E3G7_ARUDO
MTGILLRIKLFSAASN